MIELKDLTKSYGENKVIKGLSLTLADGSKTSILGPSGCGKTTLLRILAGLEQADGGKLMLQGNVALMFQEPRLIPHLTVLENLRAPLPREHYRLADQYLSAVGLAADGDKLPSELSGGMAQRVAFARFLAFAEYSGADILLLDEPFSALDCDTANGIIALLDKFAKNKTLILVTHDESHADALGAKAFEL